MEPENALSIGEFYYGENMVGTRCFALASILAIVVRHAGMQTGRPKVGFWLFIKFDIQYAVSAFLFLMLYSCTKTFL